jgi:hypothetical protein
LDYTILFSMTRRFYSLNIVIHGIELLTINRIFIQFNVKLKILSFLCD